MRQRWDAEQQRWIDDDAGTVGAQPPTGRADRPEQAGQAVQPGQAGQVGQPEQVGGPAQDAERPWWAGAETQIGTVRPPSYPSAPSAPSAPAYAAPPPPPPSYVTPAPAPPYRPAPGPGTLPVTVPEPAAGPDARGPRTVLVLIAVLAVLAGGGAGAGVWWLTREDGTGSQAGPAGPSVSAPATGSRQMVPPAETGGRPSPSDTERSLSRSAGPSPGYRRAEDPVGYRLDVPEGWVRSQEHGVSAEVVTYRSPADGRSLLIFEVVEETPAASLDLAENGPGGFAEKLSGYRVLHRSSGADRAELDYRYDDRSSGATRVVDRRFTAADGTLYAIRSSGPEGSDVRTPFDAAAASFCPTGADCPAA
ncbi:hypothetical protein SGM_3050 [Streptomyces griseoaurantiacus M045]|uniref:Uncharacterized protein n=1 Tax=Streptomyces griseoaurantiacus M045 TaxID=996637 RepID=F3NJB6_9ACTN|nr:hypothetical protein [Streptomyces griseoaurantiacus]EGG46486.1 hypothetical protein SGM_3050 [Streptomyces griseoaurantiacus M045]